VVLSPILRGFPCFFLISSIRSCLPSAGVSPSYPPFSPPHRGSPRSFFESSFYHARLSREIFISFPLYTLSGSFSPKLASPNFFPHFFIGGKTLIILGQTSRPRVEPSVFFFPWSRDTTASPNFRFSLPGSPPPKNLAVRPLYRMAVPHPKSSPAKNRLTLVQTKRPSLSCLDYLPDGSKPDRVPFPSPLAPFPFHLRLFGFSNSYRNSKFSFECIRPILYRRHCAFFFLRDMFPGTLRFPPLPPIGKTHFPRRQKKTGNARSPRFPISFQLASPLSDKLQRAPPTVSFLFLDSSIVWVADQHCVMFF